MLTRNPTLNEAIKSFNRWLNFNRRAYAFGLPVDVDEETPRWDLALSLCQTPALTECISDLGDVMLLDKDVAGILSPPSTISPAEMLNYIQELSRLIEGMLDDIVELQDELKFLRPQLTRAVNDFKACQELNDDGLF
jgi:hypothetical protein